jgi:hypothetical protein
MENKKRVWSTGGFGFYVDFVEAGTQRNEVKLIPACWFMENKKRVWSTGGFRFYIECTLTYSFCHSLQIHRNKFVTTGQGISQ